MADSKKWRRSEKIYLFRRLLWTICERFSKIAKPLTEMHPNTTIKNGKKVKTAKPFEWGKAQQEAFDQLKERLSSPPILGYANYESPFELHTDPSSNGLGAVLYQRQQGQLRVISYASKGLKRSKKNYPAAKLEFLALKWAITEKLHDYLYGANSLWLLTITL